MNIELNKSNFDLNEKTSELILKKVKRNLSSLLKKDDFLHLHISFKKPNYISNLNCQTHHFNIYSHEASNNLYTSLTNAIKKFKTKLLKKEKKLIHSHHKQKRFSQLKADKYLY